MKKFLLPFILLLSLNVAAQSDSTLLLRFLKLKCNILALAYQNNDYDMYIKYTHPALVKAMGGSEKMKEIMKEAFNDGRKIVSTDITQPNRLIYYKGSVQSEVVQNVVFQIEDKKYKTTGSLIAITYDKGLNWYFLSPGYMSLAELRTYFPELSPELDVAPQSELIEVE